MSSGHDMAVTHMNSQFWLSGQDLYMTKPTKILTLTGKIHSRLHSLMSYW